MLEESPIKKTSLNEYLKQALQIRHFEEKNSRAKNSKLKEKLHFASLNSRFWLKISLEFFKISSFIAKTLGFDKSKKRKLLKTGRICKPDQGINYITSS